MTRRLSRNCEVLTPSKRFFNVLMTSSTAMSNLVQAQPCVLRVIAWGDDDLHRRCRYLLGTFVACPLSDFVACQGTCPLDLRLQVDDGLNELLGPRRATGDEDIHGQ